MKYLLVVGDGMADRPLQELSGLTPMQAADTPTMRTLAASGEVGLVRTIPQGVAPGSDTAFLSILGFDPSRDYSGRAPLEAVALGITMDASDVALRLNLIALTPNAPLSKARILSHSASLNHDEGEVFFKALQEDAIMQDKLAQYGMEIYAGTAYRHCLIWRNAKDKITDLQTIPPHDALGELAQPILPSGSFSAVINEIMTLASKILVACPQNALRMAQGKPCVNGAWLWGQGVAPVKRSLWDEYELHGCCISAVPLVTGVCACRDMPALYVDGITGELDTNYEGKAQAAYDALTSGYDLVLVHVEAPDECGHAGNALEKTEAIHRLDTRLLKPLMDRILEDKLSVRLLIMSDHATPVALRTHTDEPVPYLLWDCKDGLTDQQAAFCEFSCAKGPFKESGIELLHQFLQKP